MASLHQRTEETTTVGRTSYPPRPRGKRGETRRLHLALGHGPSSPESSSGSVKYRVVLKCRCENNCESNKEKTVGKALLSKR